TEYDACIPRVVVRLLAARIENRISPRDTSQRAFENCGSRVLDAARTTPDCLVRDLEWRAAPLPSRSAALMRASGKRARGLRCRGGDFALGRAGLDRERTSLSTASGPARKERSCS